jgi:hypothetical protein
VLGIFLELSVCFLYAILGTVWLFCMCYFSML